MALLECASFSGVHSEQLPGITQKRKRNAAYPVVGAERLGWDTTQALESFWAGDSYSRQRAFPILGRPHELALRCLCDRGTQEKGRVPSVDLRAGTAPSVGISLACSLLPSPKARNEGMGFHEGNPMIPHANRNREIAEEPRSLALQKRGEQLATIRHAFGGRRVVLRGPPCASPNNEPQVPSEWTASFSNSSPNSSPRISIA